MPWLKYHGMKETSWERSWKKVEMEEGELWPFISVMHNFEGEKSPLKPDKQSAWDDQEMNRNEVLWFNDVEGWTVE